VIACVVVPARRARAEDPIAEAEPIRIRYAPPAQCPQDSTLVRQVLARTKKARPARDDEPARTFQATLRVRGPRVDGSLEVRELDGRASTRTVKGKTCEEVEAALALVAALIVDPRASTTPAASLILPPSTPEPPPPPPPPTPPPPPVPPPPRIVAPPAPRAIRPIPWRFESGIRAEARTGISSQPALGEGVFLGAASASPRWDALAFRLSGTFAQSADVATAQGAARFRWLLARGEACPLHAGGTQLLARACLVVEGGAVLADGIDTPDAQTVVRPWLAPGLSVRGEWRVTVSVALELEVAGVAPLVRDSFGFGPPGQAPVVSLPQVPPAIAAVSFGVAVRAP